MENSLIVANERHVASLLYGVQLEAVRCVACGRVLLEVDKNFTGAIRRKCPCCKTVNIIMQ